MHHPNFAIAFEEFLHFPFFAFNLGHSRLRSPRCKTAMSREEGGTNFAFNAQDTATYFFSRWECVFPRGEMGQAVKHMYVQSALKRRK